ncbi:MAG TPA: MtrB/PioB family outer membrane beta-barrel protein [Gammaproteobacteria bacterium]
MGRAACRGAASTWTLACALTLVATRVAAQPSATPAAARPADGLSGSVSLGVRSVEVSGTESKYREDVNLDDGGRLFGLRLAFASPVGDAPVDRVELDASNLGGDPFESIHLGVRKYGAYDLKLDRRRSAYFYDDTILPAAAASVSGATGGDYHRFDFERIRSTAALDIDVTPATRVSLGLENQTRTGDSTTTLTVERDIFDLEKPLDETLNTVNVGVRHAWRHVTLIVDEQAKNFDNTSEIFLPGASAGQNPADAAALQFFTFNQSYDLAGRSHALRVLATPTRRLDFAAGWRLEDVDLDLQGDEQASGTSAAGAPFATSRGGPGTVARDVEIADLALGFALTERVRLIGAARRSTLEQDGEVVFGAAPGASGWDIATDGYELGAELAISRAVTVAAGWSSEARSVAYAWSFDTDAVGVDRDTDRAGYFVRLTLRPAGSFDLTASIEDNRIDDPFTLASPTSSTRYKATARWRWSNGLSLSANYRDTDVDNDVSNWLADTEQADVRVVYQRPRLQLSGGYTRVDLQRSIDQAVTAGARVTLFAIDYAADSAFRDASARWQLNDRFAIGADLRAYDNRGSFALTRDDLRAFLDIRISEDYRLQISYRDLDYVEDAYDAYDAGILELAFGVSW